MSLTLEIVSRHRQELGEKGVKTFGQDGGTIGRSLQNDWSLPDSQRYLSSKHASIDFRSGSYYIVDTSRNGVFINGAEEPVGRGKPQRLFPGDRLRIGEYEMTVAIENVDDTRESLLSSSHVDPVDLKMRVESPEPTGYDLVDAHAITGVGIEMFLEEDEAETLKPLYDKYRTGDTSSRNETPAPAAPAKAPAAKARPKAAATPAPAPTPAPAKATVKAAPAPKPRSSKASPAGSPDAVAAFFRGAGIDAPSLNRKDTEQLMLSLGQITREFIVGMIDCLHLRALQKAQLKQSNTTIQARDNNRLKFSANFEEGFSRLFVDEADQYMGSVESVREAFSDLKEHQRALFAATRVAVDDYLERLEPEMLEERASNGRSGSLINAANKFKYWDLYKDVYAILANRQPNEFPPAFLDALADAYESEGGGKAPGSAEASAEQEAG